MQTPIKIHQEKIGDNRVNSILASELYKELEIEEDFSKWIENKIKQINLNENIDYLIVIKNPNEKHLLKEYILTLESAKHIAMISESPKSHEIRSYFIEIEEKHQLKLLKDGKKCEDLLKIEKDKNMDLFLKLQECQDKLKMTEQEKNYLKESFFIDFKDMEMEVLNIINQLKRVKMLNLYKDMPSNKAFDYIESLLKSLRLQFEVKFS